MSKSMEDRTKRANIVYLGLIGQHPILTKGAYKPGLKKACESYDANIDAYEKQAKRKSELTKKLGNISTVLDACRDAVKELKTKRDKVHDENLDLFNKSETEIDKAKADGDKADPDKVVGQLKDFNTKFKKLVDEDKVHADKKEKLGSEVVGDVKKISGEYEKEAKDIKSTIEKQAATGDSLEAQIRSLVATYKKTAAQLKDTKLVSDLDYMLGPFKWTVGQSRPPLLIARGERDFRLKLLFDSGAELRNMLNLYRELLAGRVTGRYVWQQLKASNRVGITHGTLEERRNPLAIQ